jgi:hypothetical protein
MGIRIVPCQIQDRAFRSLGRDRTPRVWGWVGHGGRARLEAKFSGGLAQDEPRRRICKLNPIMLRSRSCGDDFWLPGFPVPRILASVVHCQNGGDRRHLLINSNAQYARRNKPRHENCGDCRSRDRASFVQRRIVICEHCYEAEIHRSA